MSYDVIPEIFYACAPHLRRKNTANSGPYYRETVFWKLMYDIPLCYKHKYSINNILGFLFIIYFQ